MHSSNFEVEGSRRDGGEVLVAVAALVTEGRIPGKQNSSTRGYFEGPHCNLSIKTAQEHNCDPSDTLCSKYKKVRNHVLGLWEKGIPLCVEVLLTAACACRFEDSTITTTESGGDDGDLLLEQWYFNICHRRTNDTIPFTLPQLINAIRSQLHFSQLSAWLSTKDEQDIKKITLSNLRYRLTVPGENFETTNFTHSAVRHDFPLTGIGNGYFINVSYLSLPRMFKIPDIKCSNCERNKTSVKCKSKMYDEKHDIVDDRMHVYCTLKGKHRCEDYEDLEHLNKKDKLTKLKYYQNGNSAYYSSQPSTSSSIQKPHLSLNIAKAQAYYNCQKDAEECFKKNTVLSSGQRMKNPKLEQHRQQQQERTNNCVKNDLKEQSKGQILLDAILRSAQKSTNDWFVKNNEAKEKYESDNARCDVKCVQKSDVFDTECANTRKCGSDTKVSLCDKLNERDIYSIKNKSKYNIYVDNNCDRPVPNETRFKKMRDISNIDISSKNQKIKARQKLTFDSNKNDINSQPNIDNENHNKGGNCPTIDIPTPLEQAKFRKNLDSAASMVFHSRTGLPLTSSPAPVRRGKSCFDFDSSINSVSAIKSALFSASCSTDEESESDGSIVSPCSPDIYILPKREHSPTKYHRRGHSASLLGSFEESVLNGRLEPVSTVHGFRAELGASGSFVPRHLIVPVTVFFYTLGDNDKVSSPYLGHINLGKKGYNVPKTGTVQVTLFNPLGTVVKMFVIMYDLSDMPPNSQTFIRQRTLYMPTNCRDDDNLEWGPKWLRYLIHLRFMSSKSGRIYLHSDIRMIIFRKSDLDTATALGIDMSYELRSFTHMPTNPKFSPRK